MKNDKKCQLRKKSWKASMEKFLDFKLAHCKKSLGGNHQRRWLLTWSEPSDSQKMFEGSSIQKSGRGKFTSEIPFGASSRASKWTWEGEAWKSNHGEHFVSKGATHPRLPSDMLRNSKCCINRNQTKRRKIPRQPSVPRTRVFNAVTWALGGTQNIPPFRFQKKLQPVLGIYLGGEAFLKGFAEGPARRQIKGAGFPPRLYGVQPTTWSFHLSEVRRVFSALFLSLTTLQCKTLFFLWLPFPFRCPPP